MPVPKLPSDARPAIGFRRFACFSLILIFLMVILMELAGGVTLLSVGSRVYTNNNGTRAPELWLGENDSKTVKTPPAKIPAILVKLGKHNPPARLLIRYAAGDEDIYHVIGDVSLIADNGRRLWSESFDGYGEYFGPPLFALAFADLDGNGLREVFYRHLHTDYDAGTETEEPSLTTRMEPMEIARLEGPNGLMGRATWRSQAIARIMEMKLAIAMMGVVRQIGLVCILVLPALLLLFLLHQLFKPDEDLIISENGN